MELQEQWDEYIKTNAYAHPVSWLEEELDYTPVVTEIVGEWRWGNIYENVYQAPHGALVGLSYMDASGDGDIDASGMSAEFYPVEAQTVSVVKYVRK